LLIPDDDIFVGASGSQGLPVGTEGHAPDDGGVPLKDAIGTAAEGRAEEVAREESLNESCKPRLSLGLDVLLFVLGESRRAGQKEKEENKAHYPERPDAAICHDRPLAQQEVRKLRSSEFLISGYFSPPSASSLPLIKYLLPGE
jgi:hypothetical protein